MNREIKFRVWACNEMDYDKNNQLAVTFDGKLLNYDSDVEGLVPVRSSFNYTITQFTGLKDKNKEEIYEGDIIRYHYNKKWENEDYEDTDETKTAEVIYKEGSYVLDESETYKPHIKNICIDSLEVIGNIYENPELLKNTTPNA